MNRSQFTLVAGLLALSPALSALPEGPQVQAGSVQSQVIPGMMTLQQQTDRAIINWNSFSVGAQELVRVLQPNQAAILLNRVVGQDPSVILGQLQANGNLWLLNPNGILFGPGARIDVGGLLATTLNIRDQDFLEGRYQFDQVANKPLASVINQGELRVSPQGYLILQAPLVSNEGLIVANLGKVALISGEHTSLSFDNQGLIQYRLPAATGNPGPVLLSPEAVSNVLRGVVQDGGIAEGSLITQQDGRILLTGGSGTTLQAGQIQASGASVTLDSTRGTVLRPGSLISVAGNQAHPDAGSIRVLSQGGTWAQAGATLDASSSQGKGGFVEVSGRRIGVASQVDVRGNPSGTYLIDPDFLHVVGGGFGDLDGLNPITGGTAPGSNSTISVGYLESIPGGTVQLEATNSVIVDNGADFTLQPGVDLLINAISGNVTFENGNTQVQTVGAPITLQAGNSITLGIVRASGSFVSLDAPGNITSAVGLSAGNVNVSADNLLIQDSGGGGLSNVDLSSSVGQINALNAGNFSLRNTGDINLLYMNTTTNASLHNQGNVTFLSEQRLIGNEFLVNATGSIQLDPLGPPILANSVGLLSAGNISLAGQGGGPPAIVAPNVALSAAGQLFPEVGFSATNISLFAGSGSGAYVMSGPVNIVNQFGVNGVEFATGSFALETFDNIQLLAPVVAAGTVELESFSGTITQGFVGTGVRAPQMVLRADAGVGTPSVPIDIDTGLVGASSFSGNVHLRDGQSSNLYPNLNLDIIFPPVGFPTGGVYASGELTLSTIGNLNVDYGLIANNITVQATGDILLADSGEGANVEALDTVNMAAGGNFTGLGNPDIIASVANVSAGGNLSLTTDAPSLTAQATGQLQLNSLQDATVQFQAGGNASLFSGDDLSLAGNSSAGNIAVVAGNLSLSGGNLSANDLTTLTLSGNVTGAPGRRITSPNLAIQANDSILGLTVNSTLVAANATQHLDLQGDSPSLAVGTVVGLSGLQAGNISQTNTGNLSIQSGVAGNTVLLAAGGALNVTSAVNASANLTAGAGAGGQLSPLALTAPVLALSSGSGPLVGLGGAPQVTANLMTLQGSYSSVQLGALDAPAINLDLVGVQSAGLSAVNSVVLMGSPNIGDALQLAVQGDLALPGTVNATNLVALNVTGQLSHSGSIPVIQSSALSIRAGNLTGPPLATNVSQLAVQAANNPVHIDQSSSPLTVTAVNSVTGINATGAVNLTTQGPLQVLAPVESATAVNLTVNSGDLSINSAPDGVRAPLAQLNVGAGNLDLTGPSVSADTTQILASGNITGSGSSPQVRADQLSVDSLGGSVQFASSALTGPQTTLSVSALQDVQVTSANSLVTSQAVATNGNLRLDVSGNLTRQSTLSAGNEVALNLTGTLINQPGIAIQSNSLSILTQDISGPPLSTDVNTLAVQTSGTLNLSNARPNTQVGVVAGVVGVNATDVVLNASGNLSVNAPTRGSNSLVVDAANDLVISSVIESGNLAEVNAGGNLVGSGLGPHVVGQAVALTGANIGFLAVSTPSLSAQATGDVLITSPTALNVTAVGPLNGVQGSGNVLIRTGGPVGVFSPVSGSNVSIVGTSLNVTAPVQGSAAAALNSVGNIDIHSSTLLSPNASVNTTGQVEGRGLGPHIVSNNISLVSGDIPSLTLAAALPAPIDLGISSSGSVILTASNSVNFTGTPNAATDLLLSASGNITLNGTVQAGNSIGLSATGDIINLGGSPNFVAVNLGLSANNVTGLPITTQVSNLAAVSQGQLDLQQVVASPLNITSVNGTGLFVAGPLNLTTQGPLTVLGNVTAGTVQLTVGSGDLQVNAPITGSTSVSAQVSAGNFVTGANGLRAPVTSVNASGDISGLGAGPHLLTQQASLSSQNGSIQGLELAGLAPGAIGLSLQAAGSAQLSATQSVNLNAASSLGNNLELAVTGDLNLSQSLAAGNTVGLNVTGDLVNNAGSPSVQATSLGLRMGSQSGAALTTNVSNLAVQSNGALNLQQTSATPLTVSAVNGVTGVNASGPVNLTTAGPLTVNQPVTGSVTQLTVASGDLQVNAPVTGSTSVSAQVSNGNFLAGANGLNGPVASVNVSGDLTGSGFGPHLVADQIVLTSQTGSVTGLILAGQTTNPSLSISAPVAIQLSANQSLSLDGSQLNSPNLGFSVTGDLLLSNTLQAGNLSLAASGSILGSGTQPDLQAATLELLAGNSLGNATTPLRLAGNTTVAGQAGQNIHLLADNNLTIGQAGGSTGLQAGPTGSLTLVTGGNLTLQNSLGAAAVLNATAQSISGPGLIQGDRAVLQAPGAINVSTDLNGLALLSNSTVTVTELSGLSPITLGNVSGLAGSAVNLTVLQGNLDLSDPSLGNQSALVASQRIDLTTANGSIIGLNPSQRPDVVAPLVNFTANGSVGTADTPIRVDLNNSFTTTQPGFVERFGASPPAPAPPAPPPLPVGEPDLSQVRSVTVIVDATSLGLNEGNNLPAQLVLESVSSDPKAPQGLWRVSWEGPALPSPGPEPMQRPFLLDMTLEQLMQQPTTSGFIYMTLEQLLNEPLLSPFLEKTLEELLNTEIEPDGSGK